ncbi:MAG: hypothetical protein A2252_09960 [Elusimicrobia bacterium RIFOXYA2_FULL_39_19]|nr:MAG: hypothetical protein A2252_09960 [Elusimicrobia bacterium RIFOXYA2_FULL_39_19]
MKKTIIFLMLLSLTGGYGVAQEKVLLLEDAVKQSKENNPEIQAARQKYLASKSGIIPVRNLPDPVLSIEYDSLNKMNMYGFTQEIPFWGKLSLRGKIAGNEAEMIRNGEYLSKELEVIARTKTSYFLFLAASKAVTIYDESSQLMKSIIKSVEAGYITGKTSQSDVLRAQVELSKMLNMLVIMKQERDAMQAMLNVLLNNKPDTLPGSPVEPVNYDFKYSLEELTAIALKNRPELKAAKNLLEKNKLSTALFKREYLPDFMIGYKRQYMSNTGEYAGHLDMVSLNLPLWFWKQRAMVAQSKQEQEMAQAQYTNMENMTYYDMKVLYTKVKTYQQLINEYANAIIPKAKQLLEISQASYQANKTDFIDLLDSQRTLLALRLEYYQYVVEYEKNLGELERIVGRELK